MELYIPPPTQFLPRLPPPRPVVPAVPVVPIPDLPDKLYAPEGTYSLNTHLFPSIGTAAAPLPAFDMRLPPAGGGAFMGGAGGGAGFMVPPPNIAPPPGQTAMSYGSSVVNGQAQPAHPVRMSWVHVWFPPKGAGERSFFGMGGGGGSTAKGEVPMSPGGNMMSGYEPSLSSDSGSQGNEDHAPIPVDVPLAAIPQASNSKKNPWSKAGAIPANALSTLPRPKNNLRSSNSTFVTRLQAHDNLPKLMQEKGKVGGELVRWGFWNLGRTFGWGEEGLTPMPVPTAADKDKDKEKDKENGKKKEPLARVTFSQVPTCHSVSPITASPERIDIVVGFASGDIVWLDFILGKYTRINKGGLLNNTAVTSIHFDPRQPQHFLASFADATILQFNLFAEDPILTGTSTALPWVTFFDRSAAATAPLATESANGTTPNANGANGTGVNGAGNGSVTGTMSDEAGEIFEDSMMIWKNDDWAQLQNNVPGKNAEAGRSPWAGKNPTAAIKVGRRNMTGMAYSPDGRLLATVSDDGMLRLIDVAEERYVLANPCLAHLLLLRLVRSRRTSPLRGDTLAENRLTDTFAAYFGSLSCVAWSYDSRFVAVGGQDDLITIFSPRESRVVARCQGHAAFVTSIAFDPGQRGGGYRFGSVAEDGKLCLWDFSAASLHRPRHHHSNHSNHRISMAGVGSTLSLSAGSRSHLPLNAAPKGGKYHPAPPRSEVALLQPVLSRIVEGNLITAIHMSPNAIVTVSRAALVKFWQRPPKSSSSAVRAGAGVRDRDRTEKDLKSPRMEMAAA